MRFFLFFLVCIVLGSMLLTTLACPYVGPHYPVTYGLTPTPTPPTTASVTISSSTYNPAAVTISQGGAVIFLNNDPYPHSMYPSNGAACGTDNPIAASSSITLTFPTAVTIYYHCSIHAAGCNSTCLSSCSGPMTGVVAVQ
jgi:hypothetical protein